MPWKNGGGITHEVLRVPAGDGRFRWRVSVAQIDASGPFSQFAGYNRKMVLLRGSGVRLTFRGMEPILIEEAGDLVEFDGSLATECELLSGPCVDLNLMVLKSILGVRAWVESLCVPRPLQAPPHGTLLIFAISGALSVKLENFPSIELQAWDLGVLMPEDRGMVAPAALGSVAVPVESGGVGSSAAPLVFFATLTDNPR